MFMRGFGGFGGGWIGAIIGLIIMIAIVVAVIVLVIYAIRGIRRRSNYDAAPQGPLVAPPLQTPKEILQARYARGEITREQYLAMLEDIK